MMRGRAWRPCLVEWALLTAPRGISTSGDPWAVNGQGWGDWEALLNSVIWQMEKQRPRLLTCPSVPCPYIQHPKRVSYKPLPCLHPLMPQPSWKEAGTPLEEVNAAAMDKEMQPSWVVSRDHLYRQHLKHWLRTCPLSHLQPLNPGGKLRLNPGRPNEPHKLALLDGGTRPGGTRVWARQRLPGTEERLGAYRACSYLKLPFIYF